MSVRPSSRWLSPNLFGCHVWGRPGDLASPGPPVVVVHRQAEVGDVGPPARVDENIVRLQVAMHHPLLVGV